MSAMRIRTLLAKDLKLGPRSPLVLWTLIIPLALTLLVRGVFGGLFDAEPRIGIVDLGTSELVAATTAVDGFEVKLLDDEADLREQVERNDLDAGLIIQAGFDDAVRAGERPDLNLFVGGESLAATRIVVAVTALDLIRTIEGSAAPAAVEIVEVGDEPLPFELTVLPLFVVMAVALAGVMITAAGLIEEKQANTLAALLVTPSSIGEVLSAKGALGAILAVVAGTMTLAINGVLGISPAVMLTSVVLGAVMMAQVGLILGSWARDMNTMFAAWKGGGLILFYPVIFFMWPDLPAWPARFGPTFYFLEPVHRASVEGAGLADVLAELAVAAAICIALVPAVITMGRRLEGRVGRRPNPEPPDEHQPPDEPEPAAWLDSTT